jgi:prepilin-type N-terminal cleavage/methylation domain-containing protein
MNIKPRHQRGFTLIELLISLAILTAISMSLLSFLSPWMAFKQKLDTDRKLMEMKALFTTVYERNAWMVETAPAATFTFAGGALTNSALTGARSCISQGATLTALASYFSDGLPQGEQDGYGNPFCFLISPQLSIQKNGVNVYYHNLAIVSSGRNSELEATTTMSAAGALNLAGDDTGVLINGFTVQEKKFRETETRLARIATLYESYFTARFLLNPSRDALIDYFGNGGASFDSSGTVTTTGGVFASVGATLGSLGLGPEESFSAYESNNSITVGNYNECTTHAAGTTCVRSPATPSSGGAPPYTAILRAPLPGPGSNYLVKVATGNY